MSQSSAHLIRPPNTLRPKIGGGFTGIDAAAVAKAEEALRAMSSQFGQWLQDEIDKLEAAYAALRTDGASTASAETLYFRAHDLKGLGGTYQYPLVSRLAGSLCRLLDEPAKRADAPLDLLGAHVRAIRAVVRDKIQTEDHPVGRALAEELESKVTARLAA